MAAEKNYTRLGLFVVIAFLVVLATVALFVQRLRTRPVVEVVTYTNEDVSGLDVSSPVRYRGVVIGQVTGIRLAEGGKIVEINFEGFLDLLTDIGGNVRNVRRLADLGGVFPNLRARVVRNPVTGEAYLLLDFPKDPPPVIELGFTPRKLYIPSMPSPLGTVQDRLPAILDRTEATLQGLREIIARMPASLDRSDRFFTNVESIIRESQLPQLSKDSRAFFNTTSEQMEQMRSELDRVIGPEGTLVKFSEETRTAIKAADLPATTQATREAADSSRLAADDLRRSLPVMRESLQQVRDLARQLEQQPESVVYGPRPPEGGHQ
jgi:paraquat-inducible protein B